MRVFQVLGEDIKQIEFACDRVDWENKLYWRNGARHRTQGMGIAVFETKKAAAAYIVEKAQDYVRLTGNDLFEAEVEYEEAKESLEAVQKKYKNLL